MWVPFIPWRLLQSFKFQVIFFSFFSFQSNYWLYLTALFWIHAQYFYHPMVNNPLLSVLNILVPTAHNQASYFWIECPKYIIHVLKVPYIYSVIVPPVKRCHLISPSLPIICSNCYTISSDHWDIKFTSKVNIHSVVGNIN